MTLSFWLLLCGILKVNGLDLQCTSGTLLNTFAFAPQTGCKVSNLNITSRSQAVTSVNGKNLKSFTESGYKAIEIRNQPMHFIPQGLGEFFPDLEALDLGGSHIKEVIKSDFAQL